MNYEKKYKEALERMKSWAKGEHPECFSEAQKAAEFIFPELKEKESEDERIRKALISVFSNREKYLIDQSFGDITVSEALAWLENQGKTSWKPSKEEMDVLYGLSYITNEFDERKEEVIMRLYQDLKRVFFNGASFENMFPTNTSTELEKQGEQKPADQEVEPKFHKGDWVVSPNGVYWHVDAIRDGRYQVSSNSGESADWPLDTNIYHRFTIQDAKDGDVFVAEIDEEPNDFIYIFKEYNQNLGFWSHCYLDAYTNKFHKGIYHNNLNVGVPATKEQRDLLFQKMHEAGYEWDAEKKELKKIEQKHDWSEGDDKILNAIIKDIQERHSVTLWSINCGSTIAVPTQYIIGWLKSLKDRVQPQPKQEWSE